MATHGFSLPPMPILPGRVAPGTPGAFSAEANQLNQLNPPQAHKSEGVHMAGTVKSYNSKKGFGFLQSESLPGQDIFFIKKMLKPMFQEASLEGMSATFLLSYSADGKPQARKVAPTGGGGGVSWGKGGGQGDKGSWDDMWNFMMAFMAGGWSQAGAGGWSQAGTGSGSGASGWTPKLRDKAMTGTVKSYSDEKGFGFIQSPMVPTDIYFKGQGQSFSPGQAVGFFLNYAPDGKAQARGVTVSLSEGEVVVGSVKSYNASTGFGFIQVPDKPGQDIYFKKDLVPIEIQEDNLMGRQVQVMIHMSPDGKPQANALEFVDSGMGMFAQQEIGGLKRSWGDWGEMSEPKRMKQDLGAQMMMQGLECEGMVKSYNPMHGWGFIKTDMLPQDVYFKGNFPQAQPGMPCRFRLNYAPDGKPQAQNLVM